MTCDAIQAEQVARDVIMLALLSFRQRSPARACEFARVQARDPEAQFKPCVYVDEKGTAKRVEIEIKGEFYEDFARALSTLDPQKEALRIRAWQFVPCWFTRAA